MNKRQC